MRRYRLPLPAALAIITTALAGCGLSDPYTSQQQASSPKPTPAVATTTSTTAHVANDDPAPERGGTIPTGAQESQNTPATAAGRPTPEGALERYANIYINWTSTTLGRVEDELAAISVTQARAQALQAAAAYGHDSTLQRSRVANSGAVIAIAPGQGPEAGSWVIVTREDTSGVGDYAGLPPTNHITYAQVQHTKGGWVVSSWSPQQ
jgi:hypothetical protein